MTRIDCVTARKAEGFTVTAACEAAGVATTTYYDNVSRPSGPTSRDWDDAIDIDRIVDIHLDSDGTYGEPRITAELARRGTPMNHKKVARLMADNGLRGHRPVRKRRWLTQPDQAAAPLPDLIERDFDPNGLDVAWCGDITYIPTGQGWLYLATVIDLGSRRLLGWSMGDRHDATLVVDALDAAVAARGGGVSMDGTIFHHDRGSEYTSATFRTACTNADIVQSASRVGSALDNAVAESFFATLKVELVDRTTFATRTDARQAIFAWIARYNHRRLHSTCGMRPPIEYEQHLLTHDQEDTVELTKAA